MSYVSRRMRLTGHVTRMREIRNTYKILFGKPEGKILFFRSTLKWGGKKSCRNRIRRWGPSSSGSWQRAVAAMSVSPH
jgi:hypothetical protein